MYVVALLLFVIHILAFAAGSANGVVMPILGPKLATASPETRDHLFDIAEKLSKVGKIAMGTLLVTGVLTLWLKWNFLPPNAIWFWIKMAGVVAMIVFIVNNERNFKKAKAGDREAAKRSQMFGQLTGISFLVVVIAAVFSFN